MALAGGSQHLPAGRVSPNLPVTQIQNLRTGGLQSSYSLLLGSAGSIAVCDAYFYRGQLSNRNVGAKFQLNRFIDN